MTLKVSYRLMRKQMLVATRIPASDLDLPSIRCGIS